MFSIANKVDDIHKRPWIGFQSWRATGRKVSLSPKAEKALEEKIQRETVGDVVYFWTRLDKDYEATASSAKLGFWSICDLLNAGHCRTTFENAFRQMYSLPSHLEGLPPMPEDGGHWSALHSWVMPTPSFLEFTMFSRMFVNWQGLYERERVERYRQKMDKKRKNREKLVERNRIGYKQKPLGRRRQLL
ncbi:unnamed protein product [Linum trigynum]|uniref:Uncharacterized protein n=1 Tax=Linum trigynum TaxID=586398 RepID=A0AAV2CSR0_9ROSI